MKTKERLLRFLQNAQGEDVSGEELAEALGVTRAAVWKAVNSLRQEGIAIEAGTNRGYRLVGDAVTAAAVEALAPGTKVEVVSSVDSTNHRLRELAAAGAAEGTVLIARKQTAGRGRMGRSFYSPQDSGLYFSLLLRPNALEPGQAASLTAAAAVAMCQAIEAVTGESPRIKWVNDLFLRGKKISGILTEASVDLEGGTLDYAVVGIGLNLTPPEGGFPPELAEIAGAVVDRAVPGTRNRIAGTFLRRFFAFYRGEEGYWEDYRARSLVPGRTVTVFSGGKSRPAQALTVDENCRLVVRYPDGTIQHLSSGEVRCDIDWNAE